MIGTIRRKVSDKGYMFLRLADGGDVFCHISQCKKIDFESVTEGLQLEFEIVETDKGPQARNVRYPNEN